MAEIACSICTGSLHSSTSLILRRAKPRSSSSSVPKRDAHALDGRGPGRPLRPPCCHFWGGHPIVHRDPVVRANASTFNGRTDRDGDSLWPHDWDLAIDLLEAANAVDKLKAGEGEDALVGGCPERGSSSLSRSLDSSICQSGLDLETSPDSSSCQSRQGAAMKEGAGAGFAESDEKLPGGAASNSCLPDRGCVEEPGAVKVRDDMDLLLKVLPADIRDVLLRHSKRTELLEVVLDLGRRPEARFLGDGGGEYLRSAEITRRDLAAAIEAVGDFGGDNRAGVEGTLHRISALRNRRGQVVGLTCRVGRAVTGHIDIVMDMLESGQSILFLGRPGVGKTTVIREMARVLADDLHKRVVIVDTSNEIGGDGDVPHPAIGGARRMQVPDPSEQHKVMVEAVENHMPEVVIVDEIGTEAEALACRSIAERGVMLIGTAHGQMLENLIKNPTLADLVGGIHSVTLGDEEARARRTQKTVLERMAPPTFPALVEMRERSHWVAHQTDRSVDALLHGKRPFVEVRTRDSAFNVIVQRCLYDSCGNGRLDGDIEYAVGSTVSSTALTPALVGAVRKSQPLKAAVVGGDLTYQWAARIGYVPDKDAMEEMDSDFPEDSYPGYSRPGYSTTPGRRGTRRGKYLRDPRWDDVDYC